MIEIPIGIKFLINGKLCICREVTDKRKGCSKCYYKHCGKYQYHGGRKYPCGALLGNISDFSCSGDDRTDGKDVSYELVD